MKIYKVVEVVNQDDLWIGILNQDLNNKHPWRENFVPPQSSFGLKGS